jgi:hypothetical protein
MMNEEQLKDKIETDLFNDLRWLLCAATEWEAHRKLVDTGKIKQPCYHLQVYTMDSVFLHCRSLYEFFIADGKKQNRLTYRDYNKSTGQPASTTYGEFKDALHARGMNLGRNRSGCKEIKNKVLDFANDILEMWSTFSTKPGMEPYRGVLGRLQQMAKDEARHVAEQYKERGFESPFD